MALAWMIGGTVVVTGGVTWLYIKLIGPAIAVPRNALNTRENREKEIEKITKPLIVIMTILALGVIGFAVAILG